MSKMIFTSIVVLAFGFSQDLYVNNDEQVRLAPRMLNYQGYLTDTLGIPVTNPSVSMTFAIFDAVSAGNQKWTEMQSSVSVNKGIFHVLLGGVTPIPDSIFLNSTNRWLEITVGGQTLTPRTRIVSAGYAYTATYSDTAQYSRTAAADNDWLFLVSDGADTTLQTAGRWGLARAGNVLYGNADSTHVNFGVACTTGKAGQNYKNCTVCGGLSNLAGANYTFIGGGHCNKATGYEATIAGGYNNTANSWYATVGGGYENIAGDYATVSGGIENMASAYMSTIGGGGSNVASEYWSTVGGGYCDTASGEGATVSGGFANRAEGHYSTIVGGYANTITMESQYSYLFGIESNLSQDSTFMVDLPHIRFGTETDGYEFPKSRGTNGQLLATDSSGQLAWSFGGSDAKWIFSVSEGADTTLQMGGKWGLARAGNVLYGIFDRTHVNFGVACTTGRDFSDFEFCTVSGGHLNAATGYGAAVGGGESNSAGGYGTIGGGEGNSANGLYATVAGGRNNKAGEFFWINESPYSAIGGGYSNVANDSVATISGGRFNIAGKYGTVAGGRSNTTIQSYGSIGGGHNNNAEGPYASIGGGYNNYAAHYFTAIGGGRGNTAYDSNATIGGGFSNYAGGKYSTVVGGYADTITATGDYSYLFGINSNLTQDSTFMVDMPHTWLGNEATGYEFPRQRGADGQVLTLGSNGQLSWVFGAADEDWMISGSDMYSGVSGNIGIGTSTPRGKLDVDGSGDIWLVDDGLQSGSQNIHIPGSVFIIPYATGNVAYLQARRSDNSGSTELRFRTFNNGSVTEAMHISGTGHVGIGSTVPDTTLHIIGNIKIVDGNQSAGKVLTSDAAGLGTWQIPAMDNDWNFRVTDGNDTTLTTSSAWGLTRAGNVLYGNADSTHVNLGVACATGFSGQNYKYCTVAGGYNNKANNQDATVGGGCNNTAGGASASVGGGFNNTASNQFTTVPGGWNNAATGSYATVGGGVQNYNAGDFSVIVGGYADTISTTADYSYLFGINSNLTQDSTFMVDMPHVRFGSEANGYEFPRQRGADGQVMVTNASGQLSWSSGGSDVFWNFLVSDGADTTLQMGGRWGLARAGNILYGSADSTHVNLGVANTTGMSGQNYKGCTVTGGRSNIAAGGNATVSGGYSNAAESTYTTVSGGYNNTAGLHYAVVSGGYTNTASGYSAAINGGRNNFASDTGTFVGGGRYNRARGLYSVVCGGGGATSSDSNAALNDWAVISGGRQNTAGGAYSTIAGGYSNSAGANSAAIGGGRYHEANGSYSTVGGGYANIASASYSTIAGGYRDTSDANYGFTVGNNSTVLNGHDNSAAFNGMTSTAAGQTRVGALSKTSGTFTIDHPTDPENKILNHYFVESPEMVLVYRGSVVLDASGRATVSLPDYFDALNEEPLIQLTGVGSSDVYIAEEVQENSFVVGGKPGIKVHWTVTGARKDQSAEITKIIMPVEQPKEGGLVGRSLDDEFLVTTMAQLERMGKASGFKFRYASEKNRYEEMKKMLEENKDR